jgi:hypothetical protein
VNEAKFDLRVYVYVPALDPLRIYVCPEGLARFATHKSEIRNIAQKRKKEGRKRIKGFPLFVEGQGLSCFILVRTPFSNPCSQVLDQQGEAQ